MPAYPVSDRFDGILGKLGTGDLLLSLLQYQVKISNFNNHMPHSASLNKIYICADIYMFVVYARISV